MPNSSSNHVFLEAGLSSEKRDGATNPTFAGPLGATLIQKLSDPNNGIVLDSWIDADGQLGGDAPSFVP